MTDVRDREREIELVAEETCQSSARAVPVVAPRSSLVGRALTPFRRAKGREVVVPSTRAGPAGSDRGAAQPRLG